MMQQTTTKLRLWAAVMLLAGSSFVRAQEEYVDYLADVPWKTTNTRINDMVEAMTVDEKMNLVHGQTYQGTQNFAGFVAPIDRFSVPATQWGDGEAGINGVVDSTGVPTELNVGTTWSRDLAYSCGSVGGRESWLLNSTGLLAPRVNILRDPYLGDYSYSFSEDPYLNGQLGAEYVKGIQDQGVMACTKQIGPSSNGAGGEAGLNSEVDIQVLHEVYWAPHEDLINAGVATVMCSYTVVNGEPACQYAELINNTLRGDFNFTGIIMSDWGATHATQESIARGLDWEMGFFNYYTDKLYDQIYVKKNLSETYLNRAVSHVLKTYEDFGILDGRGPAGNTTEWDQASPELSQSVLNQSAAAIYEIAVRSGVLLKNDGTLPLARNTSSIGVIGPAGLQLKNGNNAGDRSFGVESRKISPLDAMKSNRPDINVTSALGIDIHGTVIPSSAFQTFDGQPGLSRNDSLGGTAVDADINFSGNSSLPGNKDYTWNGQLIAPVSGYYHINLQRHIPDKTSGIVNDTDWSRLIGTETITMNDTKWTGFRLDFNGGVNAWDSPIVPEARWDELAAYVYLDEGANNITFTVYYVFDKPLEIKLTWVVPDHQDAYIAEAVELAASVDVPIVHAHANSLPDKVMELYAGFDELISRVAAANPRTVVVLWNFEPMLMPWIDDVASVLWMGGPGQEGGWATDALLFGDANPSGRLTVSYPAAVEDTVTRDPAHPERYQTETNNTAYFTEGIQISHRYYLSRNTSTLFPFGHGLSYTSFSYADLSVAKKTPSNSSSEADHAVSFTLTNTGAVAGIEVPQLYIDAPEGAADAYPGVQFAYTKLADFDDVSLEPGESKTINFTVSTRQLSYWDVDSRSWVLAKGKRAVWVGRNVETRELVGSIEVA